MQLFGLAGWRRSGKTELMTRLLPVLAGHDLAVSAVKEARHDFDIDKPGKDTYLHRVAGASEVMLASSSRWALMHERRGAENPPCLADIVSRMTPVDLVLVEGFRHAPHGKIEVHRASLGKPVLAVNDPTILAVASDTPLDGLAVPLLDIEDTAAIGAFIIDRCGLAGLAGRGRGPGRPRSAAGPD